jgi:hypothetical protein
VAVRTLARIGACLNRLARGEGGMALPTALFAMVASMGLAGAAVMASVDVQQGSKRDGGSKSAIAAADAGANVAMMRLNRDRADLAGSSCLEGATPSNGWCPPVSGEVGGASYEYQVSDASVGCGEFDLCVVVAGTAGEVTRRVLVNFNQGPSGPGGGGSEGEEEEEKEGENESGGGGTEGLIGVDNVQIDNNADARVSVGTNGNITVYNNGNVCGNIRHGVGKSASFSNNGTQCSGYSVTEGNLSVPPVSSFIPSDIASNNSNYRLVKCTSTDNPAGCQTDGYSGKWSSTVPWDSSTRTISTSNNKTLTLNGGDYFVCQLLLSNNSHLIMGSGAKVRVFFDTPENCGLSNGAKQIDVNNNAGIAATGYQPSLGKYEMPGFYLLGSTSISTKVEWSNNSGVNEFVLYAPNSSITLQNNATFIGVIVGKTVHLNNNAIVKQDAGFTLPPYLDPWYEEEQGGGEGEEEEEEPGEPALFTPQFYVECTGEGTASTPDANC